MEEKKMITVTQKDGTVRQAEQLALFKLKSNAKQYIIYTYNEVDENDLVTLNIAEIMFSQDSISLNTIQTAEEWDEIKNVIKLLINRGDQ